MGEYRVEFARSAKKEFDALPRLVKVKAVEALQYLSINPYSELLHIKKLRSIEHLYRVRIGDYRIVYEINGKILLVLIIKIGHRREVYRSL